MCEKLIDHYPVAGWLGITCSYVKRKAEGMHWEDKVGKRMAAVVHEVLEEVKKEDLKQGNWHIPKTTEGIICCGASSIALAL